MPARHQAIEGCLLGTAVGDALGLPFEGLSRRRTSRWLRGPLGYRFFFGHGFCSDDTEHTCLVAQALLTARSEPDDEWFVHVFRHNLAWRLRLWLLGLPAGIGWATLRALLKQWMHPLGSAAGVRSAGNAPAMRSAIIGVAYGADPTLLRRLVSASTRLTHTDPRAEHGALAVAWAAHVATDPAPITPSRYLAGFRQLLLCEPSDADAPMLGALAEAVASVERREATAAFAARIGCAEGVTGFVMATVPVAVHAWLRHSEDFPGGIETVVRCGGDTDTLAAIVGGMIGARVGPEGIPLPWRRQLWEWPRSRAWLGRLAKRLAEAHDHRGDPTRGPVPGSGALPLNLPGLLLRNACFMAWVLVHGFRRLLPPY